MEVSGQLYAPAALPPVKDTPVGPRNRSRRDGEEKRIQSLPSPGIEPRSSSS
jgi:hypothetical protein